MIQFGDNCFPRSVVVVYFGSRREGENWNWAWVISTSLARHIGYLELLLKLMFVNPPDLPEQTTRALPVRYNTHATARTHTHTHRPPVLCPSGTHTPPHPPKITTKSLLAKPEI